MNFKRLLDLREDNNLLQKDIAHIMGVSQQTYSLWENGIKIIPLKHLNKLCNYYDVSIGYILNLTNEKDGYIKIENLDKKIIGKNIKKVRKDNNLTLRKLAKELGTTSSTVSAYETGKTLILTAFAYHISYKYNISIDKLIGKKEKPMPL